MERAFLAVNEHMLPLRVLGGAVVVLLLLRILNPTSAVLYCANAGDSRAVLCRDRRAVRLSRDHKPFDLDEYERIQALGGFISLRDGGRVCDDLALTRALGDFHLARYVEPRAHLHFETLDLQDCPFVTVCCDGVSDVLSDQEVVDAVLAQATATWRHRAPQILPSPRRALTLPCVAQAPDLTRGASALRDLAFVHGSTDNISALVVDLTGV